MASNLRKRTWNDPQEILDIPFSSRNEELEDEELENFLENDEDDDDMIDDDVGDNNTNMDSDEYDDDDDYDYVTVQNHGEGDANNLILDAHAISSPPPPELSPPSIIPTTEETYERQQEKEDEQEGDQDTYAGGPLPPQSLITSEIINKSKSDQEAHTDDGCGLDIGPPPFIFVPIPMTTIEIGDKSEENIDFSAAGSSSAGTSGVRKHAHDPVDDVRSSSEEEDDQV